jgi:aminoglycoside phosphotransferase (APT) family kinase protein
VSAADEGGLRAAESTPHDWRFARLLSDRLTFSRRAASEPRARPAVFSSKEADMKMHADEIDTDVSLVRRLLAGQFPEWSELAIEPVESAGTDNAIYRVGDDLAARLPRVERVTRQVEKEHRWLPRLAPNLPLEVPVPMAIGAPAEGYPWPWSVALWLEGEIATDGRIDDLSRAAIDLAGFVRALQRIDPSGGPQSSRGGPLARRDRETRDAIAALAGKLDTDAVTEAWGAALAAPSWHGPPVWTHGDLYDGNLLARDGRLSAVIDFGVLGVGDPACDLIAAWSLFSGESRTVFRETLGVDDATWARGRGWALSVGLIALPYYESTNPVMVENSRHRIGEVLADLGLGR